MAALPIPRHLLQEAKRNAGIAAPLKALAIDPTGKRAITTAQLLTTD